jgi:hypothetical protein
MEKTSTRQNILFLLLLEPSPQIATSAGILFRHTVSMLDFRQKAARGEAPGPGPCSRLTQAVSTKGGWSSRFVKRDSHGRSGKGCQRRFKNARMDSSADRDAAAGVHL